MRQAVILNDTRPEAHHGSDRVMRVLEGKLAAAGLAVAATSPVGARWWESAGFVRALGAADLVVINGEGTLHHGAARGARLLRVAGHPACGAPVVLLNALWQDNPPEWTEALRRMARVAARDARSGAALSALLGREVAVVPDLSLGEGRIAVAGSRAGIVVGDAVGREAQRHLAALSVGPGRTLVPTARSLHRASLPHHGPLRRGLRRLTGALRTAVAARRTPLHLAPDEAAYAAALGRAQLHVTGRFHGVCFSLATMTPFLALRSNAWKIEALIEEAGVDPARLRAPERLAADLADPARWDYAPEERRGIEAYLARAVRQGDALFADLGALARGAA